MESNVKSTFPRGLLKFDRAAFKVSKWCSWAGGVAVIIVMLVSVIDVIMAKIFKASFPSATEWVTYLNILIVYAPLAYVELERGHTQVDILSGRVPKAVTKGIRIFSLFLSVAVFGFLTYTGTKLLLKQIASGESSSADAFAILAFPLWLFGAIYTLGCLLATISFILTIIREFTGINAHNDSISETNSSDNANYKEGERK